jgi:hypothetical protein
MKVHSRSKVNPKIIFKIVSEVNNILVIGTNNEDIIEVLRHKKARVSQINSNQSRDIIDKLEGYVKNEFDFIILNLEITKLLNIRKLIPLISEKSKIAIFRVRNNNLITRNLRTKKEELISIFKENSIKIVQKIYGRKNSIYYNPLAHFVSYYVTYITYKNGVDLAFQEAFTEKFLQKALSFFRGSETVLTSEKK